MVGSCRIRITVPKGVSELERGATECVLALRHQGVTEGALVVRGSLAKPTFQRVKGVEEGVVELPASTDEGVLKPKVRPLFARFGPLLASSDPLFAPFVPLLAPLGLRWLLLALMPLLLLFLALWWVAPFM
jgi:hypothetical protein